MLHFFFVSVLMETLSSRRSRPQADSLERFYEAWHRGRKWQESLREVGVRQDSRRMKPVHDRRYGTRNVAEYSPPKLVACDLEASYTASLRESLKRSPVPSQQSSVKVVAAHACHRGKRSDSAVERFAVEFEHVESRYARPSRAKSLRWSDDLSIVSIAWIASSPNSGSSTISRKIGSDLKSDILPRDRRRNRITDRSDDPP